MDAWKTDKNKRSIAILRVSSKGQRENTSHEIQEKEIREYCAQHQLKLVKAFKLTESAKNSDDRKQYKAAIDFALAEGVRHVLFYMQDREARNLKDLEHNEQLVKSDEIVLHYVHDRKVLDKNSSESDFLTRDFQGVINKQYSRVLSGKVTDAQANKAENGWFPGGKLPLGYVHLRPRDENGKEIKRASTTVIKDPDEQTVRMVQREFELKAKGFSLDEIRSTALAEGLVPTRLAKTYHRNNIDWRLHNKFYYGKFDWNGKEYIGKHELIIPQHILEAVQLSFERKGRGGSHGMEEAVFSGWLRCANTDCGCQITFEKKKKTIKATGDAKIYYLYRCSNSKKLHDGLKGMYAPEERIWDQFEKALELFDLPEGLAEDIARALNETQLRAVAAHRREAETHREVLAALDQREDRAYADFSAGVLDGDGYQRQVQKTRDERLAVAKKLEEANIAITGAALKTAKDVFELATNAKLLWKKKGRLERLVYLKFPRGQARAASHLSLG